MGGKGGAAEIIIIDRDEGRSHSQGIRFVNDRCKVYFSLAVMSEANFPLIKFC